MRDVVLVGAVRTATGKFGGALSGIPAVELGSTVIGSALERTRLKGSDIDSVIMGCVLQAGLGKNPARQAAIRAGLPVQVPAVTINCVCGSGLESVCLAAAMIMGGDADTVVAGGMESMSRAPYLLDSARFGYRLNDGKLVDAMVNDGLTDAYGHYHMGMTAEDVFAVLSQQKCQNAQASGRFADEIVPVCVKTKNDQVMFTVDECPRAGVNAESLAALSPVFKSGGTVTAANASGISDGAAAVIVMSAEKAEELGITPAARIVATASVVVDPATMGIGPVYSTRKALRKAGLEMNDIDLVEANEAFAAQSIAVARELGWDMSRVNVNGGAIALGHPIGATGARMVVTLLLEMKNRSAQYGLATLCVGGGMGITAVVQSV